MILGGTSIPTTVQGSTTTIYGTAEMILGRTSIPTTIYGSDTFVSGSTSTTLGRTSTPTTIQASSVINMNASRLRFNNQCINSIRLDLCYGYKEILELGFVYRISSPFTFNIIELPYFNSNSFNTNSITFDILVNGSSIYSVKPELRDVTPSGQFGTLVSSSISVTKGQSISCQVSSFIPGAVAYGVNATILCN
jgi:hypothetical protein